MALLGVSQATVRTALDGLVGEGLIQRRRALGTLITRNRAGSRSAYDSPNSTVSRGAATAHIAIIFPIPVHENYSNTAHLTAITAQANTRGIKVTLIAIDKGDDWQSTRTRINFSPVEGGIIFLGGFHPATLHDLHNILSTQGYRTAAIGLPLEDFACSTVGIDNRAFVRTGLEHLRAAGHRRIAFLVGEPEQHPEVIERVRHFEELARELKFPNAEVIHGGCNFGDNAAEVASRTATNLWQERPAARRPTALFGISDSCAAGALYGLAHCGVRVPDDVSILGYDGTQLTQVVQPSLATLVTPMNAFATALLALLDEPQTIIDPNLPARHIQIAPEFRPGPSLRSLRQR